MKLKLIAVAVLAVTSSSAVADGYTQDVDGNVFTVYTETVKRAGDWVQFTLGLNNGRTITTQDVVYNCMTHRDNNGDFLAPGSVARDASDYACGYDNVVVIPKATPSIPDVVVADEPQGVNVFWTKYNSYGQKLVATDIPCADPTLLANGYQYKITSGIPLSRLHNITDAYSRDDSYAVTVVGCWSPANHKVFWHRKSDGKQWEEPFAVGNDWVKSYQ